MVIKYSDKSVYFSAHAKLPSDMPSGEVYKAVDVGLIINSKTGEIEDAAITLLTTEAISFLKQIIVGYNLNENSIDGLTEKIKNRYMGASQKAICVTLKLIYEKYADWKKDNK